MKNRNFLVFLLCGLAFITGCSDNGDGPDDRGDDIKIDVIPGMDLVGAVTYTDGSRAAGVVVSDGYGCTITDSKGIYQLARHEDSRYVFFSYPEHCEIQTGRNNIPDFFRPVTAPTGSVFRQDFTLKFSDMSVPDSFVFYAIADPQIKTDLHKSRFRTEILADMNANISEQTRPCIAATLGDICDDNAPMFPQIAEAFNDLDIPCFHVIGNHDFDRSIAAGDNYYVRSLEAYESSFCPVDYSFNFGNVHFVVMSDIRYSGYSEYHVDLNDDQIEWLRQDLSYVPKTKKLILLMHAPLRTESAFAHRAQLLEMITQFKEPEIFVGHVHYNSHYFHTNYDNLHEHMVSAACGLFWYGRIASDGSPNGYGVYDISGTTVTSGVYKSAEYPIGYQARIYDPADFSGWAGTDWERYVICNVWNSNNRWKVELYEDGVKTADMTRYSGNDWSVWNWIDTQISLGVDRWGLTNIGELYRAVPASPTSAKSVKITDDYGNVFWQEETTRSFNEYSYFP